MRRVMIESPYAGKTPEDVTLNEVYLRAALKQCLLAGEAPFASHGLYTLHGVLDDKVPEQRSLGMKAGFAFIEATEVSVVYEDLGISSGMLMGMTHAIKLGHPIERRRIPGWENSRACPNPDDHNKTGKIALDGVLVCVHCGRTINLLQVPEPKVRSAQSRIVPASRSRSAGPVAQGAKPARSAQGIIKGSRRR